MVKAGGLEITYQTCPMELIILKDGRFFADKLFHQFRCTKMRNGLRNVYKHQMRRRDKINDKVFDPSRLSG